MLKIKVSFQCPRCNSNMYLTESSRKVSLRCYKCKLSVEVSLRDIRSRIIEGNILNWCGMIKQLYSTYLELYCD